MKGDYATIKCEGNIHSYRLLPSNCDVHMNEDVFSFLVRGFCTEDLKYCNFCVCLSKDLIQPVYSDDGKTPVRGGSRQRKKTDGEVFEMWLENYPTDEIETNDNNEISIEEFSDEHFEGEKQE